MHLLVDYRFVFFLFYQQFWNEVLSKIEIFAFANQNIGNVKLQGERSLTVWQGEWRSIIAYVTHAICTAPLICVVLVYFVNVNVGKLDYAALTRQFKSTHFIISHHHCSGNCQITCWYCKWNLNEVYFYIALHLLCTLEGIETRAYCDILFSRVVVILN